jgi:hypothetical protein
MAYIPRKLYSYYAARYHAFNIPEEIAGFFNTYFNGEAIYDIAEGDPQEFRAAMKEFKDNSTSIEVVNSTNDFGTTTPTGSYDQATGVITFGADEYLNIGTEFGVTPYYLVDGYYRVEIVFKNIDSDTPVKIQHFSACDNFSIKPRASKGNSVKYEFPFFYDSTSTCSGLTDNVVFSFRGDEGSQAQLVSIKVYEAN